MIYREFVKIVSQRRLAYNGDQSTVGGISNRELLCSSEKAMKIVQTIECWIWYQNNGYESMPVRGCGVLPRHFSSRLDAPTLSKLMSCVPRSKKKTDGRKQ